MDSSAQLLLILGGVAIVGLYLLTPRGGVRIGYRASNASLGID